MPAASSRRRPRSSVALTVVATLAVVVACSACSTGPSAAESTPVMAEHKSLTTTTLPGATTATTSPATPSTSLATATPTTAPTPTCVDALASRMTPEQRAGQLVMVGLQAGASASTLDALVRDRHVGGVVLLGTWDGAATVRSAAAHLQQMARGSSGVGMLVSADQEGGAVQHLRGAGFTSAASALAQGRDPAAAGATAARTGRELMAAGVNVDLAPVADVVDAGFASRNAPIGAYRREYGNDPVTASRAVTAVVSGMQGAGVSATLKHFPGLGRVTGNTDLTAVGTTDDVTSGSDPWLQPFRDGIAAGSDLVMVSSALYPRIDGANRAVFSPVVIGGLLRRNLGFAGVVVTDDVGAAKAVASVPVGERATRFVAAGGDIVLTGLASTVPTMTAAITAKATSDPGFAAQVDASVHRVLALKVKRGLAPC